MVRSFLTICLTGLSIISGCYSRRSEANQERRIAAIESRQLLSYPVKLIDKAALYRLIHKRRGKPLLLNIWATWCQPCVEEFPDLVRLSKDKTNIEVVGISVDYPDEMNSKVIPFLVKLKVPFQVYVAQFEKQEDFIAAVDSTWSGAVPATYIYDKQGNQRFSIIGEQSYKQFKNEVNRID